MVEDIAIEQRKTKNILFKIIYILFIVISLWTEKMGIIPYRWYTQYILGIILIGVYIITNRFKIMITRTEKKALLILAIPNLLILIYTMIIMAFDIAIKYEGSYTRAIGLFIYSEIAICVGYVAYKKLKIKVIDYTFVAFLINYAICIIIQLSKSGIDWILLYIVNSTTRAGMIIEAHELAATIPLFFAYYALNKDTQFRKTKLALCLLVVVMAQKRVVFPTMIITVLLIIIFRFKKYQKIILQFIGYGCLISMVIYIVLIKTGTFFELFDNINFMGRQYIWTGIEEYYELTPWYLGNGSGFTQKWLDLNSFNLGFNVTHQIGALHNDVLRMYIEYGFFGFLLYMYNYLILNTKRIQKWNSLEASKMYLVIAIAQLVIWFVDNVSTYYNFQIVFSIIVFTIILNTLQDTKKESLTEGEKEGKVRC